MLFKTIGMILGSVQECEGGRSDNGLSCDKEWMTRKDRPIVPFGHDNTYDNFKKGRKVPFFMAPKTNYKYYDDTVLYQHMIHNICQVPYLVLS
jgi:hypothetical protein